MDIDFETLLSVRGYFDVPIDIQYLLYDYCLEKDNAEIAYQSSKDMNDKEGMEYWQAEINRIWGAINNLLDNNSCIG